MLLDRAPPNPDRRQLPPRNDPVLAVGQLSNRATAVTSVHVYIHEMYKGTLLAGFAPVEGSGAAGGAQPSSCLNAQRTSSTLRPLATHASSFIRAAWGERKPAGMIAVPRRSCSEPA